MYTKEEIKHRITEAVRKVRAENPMAGAVTNIVTINFVANAQLAVGGSAAMVYLPEEGEFLAAAGGATYINVGTLLPIHAETLPRTAATLHKLGKPWVLDPVAIGIGEMRSSVLKQFQEYKPSIIRGNASEIIALAGLWGLDGGAEGSNVRGVDSRDSVEMAKTAAAALARYTNGAVAVSGKTDLITDGKAVAYSYGGSHFMEKITGCGCSLGGVAAVYVAAASPFIAALTASAVYNLAGKRAEEKAQGPGSFYTQFLDELYLATPEEIAENPFDIEAI